MPKPPRSMDEPRLSRLQPPRGCKKIEFHSDLGLLGLPEDVIRAIVEYSKPHDDGDYEDESQIWFWMARTGSVCHMFHELVKDHCPTLLNLFQVLQKLPSRKLWVPFLESFVHAPWKGARVDRLVLRDCLFGGGGSPFLPRLSSDDTAVCGAIRCLLTSTHVFPNLSEFHCSSYFAFSPFTSALLNSRVLLDMAESRSQLSSVRLIGVPGAITAEELTSFARSLPALKDLSVFGMMWMTDDDAVALFRHLRNIRTLNLWSVPRLSDCSLNAIAQHCPGIQGVTMNHASLSTDGARSFLETHGASLELLGLTGCSLLGVELITLINQYSPNLEVVALERYEWFTDDLFDSLVKEQIRHHCGRHGRSTIPLRKVIVDGTRVTRAGVRQIIARPGVGSIQVRGGDGWVEEVV